MRGGDCTQRGRSNNSSDKEGLLPGSDCQWSAEEAVRSCPSQCWWCGVRPGRLLASARCGDPGRCGSLPRVLGKCEGAKQGSWEGPSRTRACDTLLTQN